MALPAGVDPVIFGDLKNKYDSGDVVVFAGAGVSMAAGLPGWKELATRLADRMRQLKKPPAEIDEVDDEIGKGQLVAALSAACASLGPAFNVEIRRHLDDAPIPTIPPIAQAIAALDPILRGVVTTNLDRFLERAFHGNWPMIVQPVQDLLQKQRYIFKPHGTIDDANAWVFTRPDYDRVMFGWPQLQTLFQALYHGRTLLFVGASLTDDDFGLTLARVRALAGQNPPTHFAILSGPLRPNQQRQLENAGIQLLVYTNTSGIHSEVVDILRELAGATATLVGPGAPAPTPPLAPPPLAPPAPAAPLRGASPPAAPPRTAAVAAKSAFGPGTGGHNLPATAALPGPAAGVAGPRPVVYLSASPADEKLRDRLIGHFQPLETTLRLLTEKDVLPGMPRTATLTGFVASARIVLLLISADYLASREHMAIATQALAARPGGTLVVPVIARACGWKFGPLSHLEPIPSDGKPIATRSDVDGTLLEVVEGVRKLLDSP